MKKVQRKGSVKAKKGKKVLILGVGNVLLSDEGVGVRAVEALRRRYRMPLNVKCVDGGTMGLGLLPCLDGCTDVIIVDAVIPRGSPGKIHRFTWDEASREGAPALKSTVHQIGVSELLMIAGFEGMRPRVRVVGIEPHDLSPGLGLSPLIAKRLPFVLQALKSEIRKTGASLAERKSRA